MKNAPNQSGEFFIIANYGLYPNIIIFATCYYLNSNATYSCSDVLSPLRQGCDTIIGVSTCAPEINKYSNYISYFQSLVSDTSGLVSFASTALNANNIVQGLNEITTYIAKNPNTGCSGNAVIGGASSQMDLYENITSVSSDMRNGLMAITCYSSMSSNSDVSMKQSQVNIMINLSENIMKKYSNWTYWNEPNHYFPNNDWKQRSSFFF